MPPREPPERPDIFVLLRFLERLHFPDGGEPVAISRSALQRRTRVNYDIFRAYLGLLLARGFVEVVEDARKGERVQLTGKGREFYRKSLDWIESVVGRGGI